MLSIVSLSSFLIFFNLKKAYFVILGKKDKLL